jgi:glycosyltransferase involved in cell wall biosynthesis
MKPDIITVLHLCEHFGGVDASLHGVARAFQWQLPLFDRSRFRVLLCSRKGHDKAAAQMVASGLSPLYLGYGKTDPRNLAKLVGIVRQERVDIIHAHGFGSCMWARLAGRGLHVPVIVHGRANYKTVPFIMRPVERVLGPGTKHALAVSESTRRYMIHKRHIPERAVRVLYNGILLERVPRLDQQRVTELRAANGATPQHRVLGVVGRIVGHKGHLDLFEAVRIAAKQFDHLRLWVIGDGDFMPALEDWIKKNRFQEKIRLLGFRSDVMDLIQCLDVQIFPSHLEGTPNTLFEALAVGNCIVANPVDGQGEILEDGVTALLYQIGDSRGMARSITRVLEDDALAEKLRKNALARSRDFDGHKCVAEMQRIYEEIAAA